MGRLDGKVSLITGGGAGIGRASAELFAAEGARVAIAERNADTGAAAAQAIEAAGGEALSVATDVAVPEEVERVVQATLHRWGRIDVLYNNAGGATGRDGKVTEMPLDEFWRTIGVDLFGPFLFCRHVIPHMVAQGGGSIINTTSIRALIGTAGADAYSAAKGGVIALTKALAMQWGAKGIRVNAIGPGIVLTERVQGLIAAGGAIDPTMHAKHVVGTLEPIDIAHMALYLASDESRRITGAILPAESGASAH